jgi:class 3 adenylate cyclase
MFERSAQLVAPGRRAAAVMFADLEGSTALSRRMPTARYFEVIRDLMSGMDEATIRGAGVVGKHGGDGATAFFLADQTGGSSAAARAAVAAARDIGALGARLGVAVNVGVHWGETLYLGQVTTGGRLEVTALGDEVNECARIQESGTGGALLASKALLERLDAEDAAALGLDVGALEYRVLAELGGASGKAVRDAGTLPVADVARPAAAG